MMQIVRRRIADGIRGVLAKPENQDADYGGPEYLSGDPAIGVLDVAQAGFPVIEEVIWTEMSSGSPPAGITAFSTSKDERAIIRAWDLALTNSDVGSQTVRLVARLDINNRPSTFNVILALVQADVNPGETLRLTASSILGNELPSQLFASLPLGIRVPPDTDFVIECQNTSTAWSMTTRGYAEKVPDGVYLSL